jgi:ornithine cyclodeaminase/alanine dehydrogenase
VKPGRARTDELIVNTNIGMAACDITVGHAIFHRALDHGSGSAYRSDRRSRPGHPMSL